MNWKSTDRMFGWILSLELYVKWGVSQRRRGYQYHRGLTSGSEYFHFQQNTGHNIDIDTSININLGLTSGSEFFHFQQNTGHNSNIDTSITINIGLTSGSEFFSLLTEYWTQFQYQHCQWLTSGSEYLQLSSQNTEHWIWNEKCCYFKFTYLNSKYLIKLHLLYVYVYVTANMDNQLV